jgi:hemerythrin-like domain-containing protein
MRREARVISSQHRQLDEFYERLTGAIDRGEADATRAAFMRFADALEAHFALEDGLYFPALRGLAPRLTGDLEALCDEHQRLREQLAHVARLVERGVIPECARPLDQLAVDLAEHEGREEGLLALLQHQGDRT